MWAELVLVFNLHFRIQGYMQSVGKAEELTFLHPWCFTEYIRQEAWWLSRIERGMPSKKQGVLINLFLESVLFIDELYTIKKY